MSVSTWSDGLPAERLTLQQATRARMCPPVAPVPVVDSAPAVLMYIWYWSLSPKERAKVDADSEQMRQRLNYV